MDVNSINSNYINNNFSQKKQSPIKIGAKLGFICGATVLTAKSLIGNRDFLKKYSSQIIKIPSKRVKVAAAIGASTGITLAACINGAIGAVFGVGIGTVVKLFSKIRNK